MASQITSVEVEIGVGVLVGGVWAAVLPLIFKANSRSVDINATVSNARSNGE